MRLHVYVRMSSTSYAITLSNKHICSAHTSLPTIPQCSCVCTVLYMPLLRHVYCSCSALTSPLHRVDIVCVEKRPLNDWELGETVKCFTQWLRKLKCYGIHIRSTGLFVRSYRENISDDDWSQWKRDRSICCVSKASIPNIIIIIIERQICNRALDDDDSDDLLCYSQPIFRRSNSEVQRENQLEWERERLTVGSWVRFLFVQANIRHLLFTHSGTHQ